jgi:acetolactate synthase-1/3 small subunit
MNREKESHLIGVTVENKPGVLYRISNMFSRRDFNIESISVGSSEQENISRMTIAVNGDERTFEQVVKNLKKMIDVIKVTELDPANSVIRELALVKVNTPSSTERLDIIHYVDIFRGHAIDVSSDSITIELTGSPDKISAFVNSMKTFGIKEVARTGMTALPRGSKPTKTERRI